MRPMYQTLLFAHSWLRWIVVLLVLLVVVAAIAKKVADANGRTAAVRLSPFAIIAIDIQFLIGIVLYVFLTPHMANLLQSGGAVMRNSVLRYWSVEHAFGMIILTALAHIGRVKMKKAATPELANKRALVWFGIVLAILLITMPWPFMPYMRPLVRM